MVGSANSATSFWNSISKHLEVEYIFSECSGAGTMQGPRKYVLGGTGMFLSVSGTRSQCLTYLNGIAQSLPSSERELSTLSRSLSSRISCSISGNKWENAPRYPAVEGGDGPAWDGSAWDGSGCDGPSQSE